LQFCRQGQACWCYWSDLLGAICSFLAPADSEYLAAAGWTDTLGGGFAILHGDGFSIFHFFLGFAFDTVSFHAHPPQGYHSQAE
jgi:hypothetical protein